MNTLTDIIKYDGKVYSELTEPSGKLQIEKLAGKLKPLESEIIKYPGGSISIMKSGNQFISGFPNALLENIYALR